MGRYLELAGQVRHHPPIRVKPEDRERQVIRAALRRLQFGETTVIRLYSHTCGGQMLVMLTDEIPESITIDCPTFTLAELRRLIGSSPEHVLTVYELKLKLPGTTITGKQNAI